MHWNPSMFRSHRPMLVAVVLLAGCSESERPQPPRTTTPQAQSAPAASPSEGATTAPATNPAAKADASEAPTLQEIVDRYIEVTGGKESWERFTSRRLTYSLELEGVSALTGEAITSAGEMVVLKKAPNKLLSWSQVPNVGELRQGYNGEVGWSMDPARGVRVLNEQEVAAVAAEATFNREIKLHEGAEVVGIDVWKFNTRPSWRVRLTSAHGEPITLYFDQESGLLTGLSRQLQAGGSFISVTQLFSEYKSFDGILLATRIQQRVVETNQVMTLTAVDHAPVDDAKFELPEVVKEAMESPDGSTTAPATTPATMPATTPDEPAESP